MVFASLLAPLPYVFIYLKNLWEQAHYQFFPLLIGAVAYLAYSRWGGVFDPGRSLGGRSFRLLRTLLLSGGIFGTLCATIFASPWMGYFGFAATLIAWFGYRADKETIGSLIHLGLPIALIWQPPYDTIRTADTILIQQLQLVSAKLSSKVLDTLGFVHFQPGTVLEVPGRSFGVAEACSGIQSFFAVLCVAALLVAYFRRNLIHSFLLLATSPFWAVLMNTIRITVIPIAYELFDIDLSHGLVHDLLGYTTMGLAIALLFSTDELISAGMVFWTARQKEPQRTSVAEKSANAPNGSSDATPSHSWNTGMAFRFATGMFALCFIIQAYDTFQSWSIQKDTIDFFRDDSLVEMAKSDMPSELSGWQLTLYDRQERGRHNDDMGERSDLWYYGAPFGRVSTSFDQRFPGWHELTRCYRSAGWKMKNRQVLLQSDANDWPIVCVDLERRDEFGYLQFSLKTRGGQELSPPGSYTYWTILQERLLGRLTPAVRGALFGTACYQMQIFASTSRPLSDVEKQEIDQRFRIARERLWNAAYDEIESGL